MNDKLLIQALKELMMGGALEQQTRVAGQLPCKVETLGPVSNQGLPMGATCDNRGPYAGVFEWVVSVDFMGNAGQLQAAGVSPNPWSIFLLIQEGFDGLIVPTSQPAMAAAGTVAGTVGFFPQTFQVPIFGGCYQARGDIIKATVGFFGISALDIGVAIKPGRLVRSHPKPQYVSADPANPNTTGAVLTQRRSIGVRALPDAGPLPGDSLRFETGSGTIIQTIPSPPFPAYIPIPHNATVCRYVTTAAGIVTVGFEFEVEQ